MNELRTKIIFDNGMEWKISQTHCSVLREAIITRIESVERRYYEACTGVIRKNFYELVHFLQSYDVQKVKFSIRSDRCNVEVDNK